jgi:hypothetical protein
MAIIALKAMEAEDIEIEYDSSKPDGQFRKDVSIELLKTKFPNYQTVDLYSGIRKTYSYLLDKNIL